jgi:hypothetical protein
MVYDGQTTTVWAHQAGQFVIVAEAPGAPAGPGPRWHLKTEAGAVMVDRDSTDCGCGHPLKRYTPQRTPGAHRVYATPTDA